MGNLDKSADLDVLNSTESVGIRTTFEPVYRRFEAMAARWPDRVACRSDGQSLSYGDLNRQADRLALRLRALGVGRESRVAIHLARSMEMVIAIVAVLKAGGAYVPLDPEHPEERRRFYVEDSGATVLLSRSSLWAGTRLPPGPILLCLEKEEATLRSIPDEPLAVDSSPEDLAYVIYTSGSTGRPKGVLVTHHNLARLFSTTETWFDFGGEDVWTLFHSFAFDFSIWEMWGALLYGGRLVVVPFPTSRDPQAMVRLLDKEGVTVLSQTPSAFRQLAPALLGQTRLPPLRYVIFGGEALEFRSLRTWLKQVGDQRPRLINMYGITETTVHVTYRQVYREDAESSGPSRIGVPLPDLTLHLWSEDGEPVPDGETGEIVVEGPGVARGYHGRPEQTRERFLVREGRRFYRSGDLARRLPGGDLQYLGRRDDQVKIRGFRIELGEIAARIAEHGSVAHAAVRAIQQGNATRLVAYCQVRPGSRLSRRELRRFLQLSLPEPMLPSSFVEVERLPLTPNGKLDLAALPVPDSDPVEFMPPQTESERQVAAIFREVLGLSREIGRDDSFLALGGDSIAAARVLQRLRELRGAATSFRELLTAPTVADYALMLDSSICPPGDGGTEPPSRRAAGVLSFAEEQILAASRLTPDEPLYSECVCLRVTTDLDVERFEQAIYTLAARHTALRTTYAEEGGVARRVVRAATQLLVQRHDLRSLPEAQRTPEHERWATARVRQGFDLACGPLFRVDVFTLSASDYRILFSFHHAVLDGSACTTLVAELAVVYQQGPQALPPVQLQLDDAAAQQRQRLADVQARQLSYWRERLAGLQELDLPADHARRPVRSFRGARIRRELDSTTCARLRTTASEAGATLFTALLSAAFVLCHRLTGETDLAIGTITSGRHRPELLGVVGCLVNPVVIRQRLDPSQPFRCLIPTVRDALLDAHTNSELPFATLVRELGAAGDASKNPLFQVAVSANVRPWGLPPDWSVETSPFDSGTSRFDLTLQIDEHADSLDLHFEYSLDRFNPETAERLADRYVTLLQSIPSAPEQPMGALAILSLNEQETLRRWGDGGAPVHSCLFLEKFRHHAQQRPHALAVCFGAEELTYEELDRRSDSLADQLVGCGVRAEEVVGLCTPASAEWVVGMLGVLKAGAAFLPLDPTYPQARLDALAADAGFKLLCLSGAPHLFPGFAGKRLDLSAIRAAPGPRPLPALTAQHLAYVIYTSGSTGRPKGVMIEHGSLANLSELCVHRFGLTPADRMAQMAPTNFDACIFEVFSSLSAGGVLLIAPAGARIPGQEMLNFLETSRITALFLVPSTLSALPAAPLPDLRLIVCGGDRLGAETVDRWGDGRMLFNGYGPTETTVFATTARCVPGAGKPPIGIPVSGAGLSVVDAELRPVPIGSAGELLIGGQGVARGYLNRPELTAERFIPDPLDPAGSRMYRTGDRVRFRADGQLDFLARGDRQVKLRGFRIELAEIESVLLRQPRVAAAVVVLHSEPPAEPRLVAYVVLRGEDLNPSVLRAQLSKELPPFMIPSAFVQLPAIPLSPIGKIDFRSLPPPQPATDPTRPLTTDLERAVAALWCEILHLQQVGAEDRFFEVGGDSLSLARVQALLRDRLRIELDMLTLLRLPTIRSLAAHINARSGFAQHAEASKRDGTGNQTAAAIIGMALRGPGVRGLWELWPLLVQGRDAISRFPEQDSARPRPPGFVAAEGILEDALAFDAELFGITASDAALMDPQHRIFLESTWAVLEDAGYDPRRYKGRIGVFAGAGMPRYWLGPVQDVAADERGGTFADRAELLNAPEFLTSRVAFKLGLRGPAVTLQTACSTSLAAVHLARQSLLTGECDLAIAGGVSLASLGPDEYGYVAAEGGILSPEGRCRPFGSAASGTVKSSGVALVVLKRLADAERDGDDIRAVLRGSALNNDGSDKLGFSAPSEAGQTEVLRAAYRAAEVDPSTVSFVQAHGTGTALGDAIEVAALKQVMGKSPGTISLTSIKANLGHLDAASGAAGLIAAVLALQHRTVPGMPGVDRANPLLQLADSPFIVHSAARPLLPLPEHPLRAGVSAFGIGGTNVHVVLEAPEPRPAREGPSRAASLLCLSARSEQALDRMVQDLQGRLRGAPDSAVSDAAYTLAVGRAPLAHRRAVVLSRGEDAAQTFSDPERWLIGHAAGSAPAVGFLFPGQGRETLDMGRVLYREHTAFRTEIDGAIAILKKDTGLDLAPYLLSGDPSRPAVLNAATLAQPATFVVSYAMARLLEAWGIAPSVLFGHSLGEYAAACIAGVFSLRDALRLMWQRGRMMDSVDPGSMLAVFAARSAIAALLDADLSVATEAPGCTVVSGPLQAVGRLEERLTRTGWEWTRLPLQRAAHSRMMESIRIPFAEHVAALTLQPPSRPLISCLTGTWLAAEEATSARYWSEHLCGTMNLSQGFTTLLTDPGRLFIDVGPGKSMLGFLRRHPAAHRISAVAALPNPGSAQEAEHLLRALGYLFTRGIALDWDTFYAGQPVRRVSLPTYPFERRAYVLRRSLPVPNAPTVPAGPAREPAPAAPVRPGTRPDASEKPFVLLEEAARLDARLETLLPELRTQFPKSDVREQLNRLCAALVRRYFTQQAGVDSGQVSHRSALRTKLRILPRFERMFDYLLKVLHDHGMAAVSEDQVRWLAEPSTDALRAAFVHAHPEVAGLLRYLEHCVDAYPGALTGEVEAIGVLYPDGTDALYRECMAASAPLSMERAALQLGREVACEFVRKLGRRARLLEVGAGHGTLTWPLMEALRGTAVEYAFTDIGRSFLNRAREEAERRALPWLTTGRFDLNEDPERQGYARGHFDLVLGFNAVHTARDTLQTLRRLKELLAPSGMLILVEATHIELWEHLIWGLAPGFWDVTARSNGSLLHTAEDWQSLTERAGLPATVVLPRSQPAQHDHIVLVAQQSAKEHAAARALATCADDEGASQTLSSIWRRLLGVEHIEPATSFYALGGDSLLAVQLLAEVRVRLRTEVRLGDFAQRPTFEGLLRLAGKQEATQLLPHGKATPPPGTRALPACIVPLQPQGGKTPLFFVHGIGGSAASFVALAEHLGPEQPSYGLQAPLALDAPSVQSLAASYTKAVRDVQPSGPYLLAGWSFGAVVAHEMARQLEEQGQVVEDLFLIDAPGDCLRDGLRRTAALLLAAKRALAQDPSRLRGHGAAHTLRELAHRMESVSIFVEAGEHHLRLLSAHEPGRVKARVTHLRAAHRNVTEGLLWGWSKEPPPASERPACVVDLPGDHFSILRDAACLRLVADRIASRRNGARPSRHVTSESEPQSEEESVLAIVTRFLELSAAGPRGNEVVQSLFLRDPRVLLFDSYDSNFRGFEAIDETYELEYQAIASPQLRMYEPFVRIAPGGQAACAAALLDAKLLLRQSRRPVEFLRTRVTWALEKHEGQWKIIHVHYSIPVGIPLRQMDAPASAGPAQAAALALRERARQPAPPALLEREASAP